MNTIREDLQLKKILVSDGSLGTFLSRRGMQPGECPELWNVEHADVVQDIARAYAEAGSDLVSTNSFGGSRFKLAHFGLAERAAELNEAAARNVRIVVGPDVHVLASIGSSGKILMMGDVTEEELYDAFREQAIALERGGADACVIETMTALDEAVIAIKAVIENTSLETACTFTYDAMPDGTYRTMMGVSPTEMAAACLEAGATIVGANCGQGPDGMIGIVQELHAATSAPIMIQANAGRPVHVDGKDVFPATPEDMGALVPALIQAGASILGGCCGTFPEHILAIAQAVARKQSPSS